MSLWVESCQRSGLPSLLLLVLLLLLLLMLCLWGFFYTPLSPCELHALCVYVVLVVVNNSLLTTHYCTSSSGGRIVVVVERTHFSLPPTHWTRIIDGHGRMILVNVSLNNKQLLSFGNFAPCYFTGFMPSVLFFLLPPFLYFSCICPCASLTKWTNCLSRLFICPSLSSVYSVLFSLHSDWSLSLSLLLFFPFTRPYVRWSKRGNNLLCFHCMSLLSCHLSLAQVLQVILMCNPMMVMMMMIHSLSSN